MSFRLARRSRLSALSVLALLALPSGLMADIFLQLDSIPGSSVQAGFENTIAVSSFTVGQANKVSGMATSRSAGKAEFATLDIVKNTDKASTQLALAAANGRIIPSATLTVTQSVDRGTAVVYTIVLNQVQVTSYKISGGESGLDEAISLQYQKITWSYYDQEKGGRAKSPMTATWNTATNSEK